MPTDKQKANLRRGGVRGTEASAARAREAARRHREREEAARERVAEAAERGDALAVLQTLLMEAARAATSAYARFNRSRGSDPPTTLMGLSREVRSLVDRVLEYDAPDHDADARRWFQALEEAITCPGCGTLRVPMGTGMGTNGAAQGGTGREEGGG